nr:ras-interacting protein 1-like [Peromyscus maniculatus bairdii]
MLSGERKEGGSPRFGKLHLPVGLWINSPRKQLAKLGRRWPSAASVKSSSSDTGSRSSEPLPPPPPPPPPLPGGISWWFSSCTGAMAAHRPVARAAGLGAALRVARPRGGTPAGARGLRGCGPGRHQRPILADTEESVSGSIWWGGSGQSRSSVRIGDPHWVWGQGAV